MESRGDAAQGSGAWVGSAWHVSRYAFEPEVRARMQLPERVTVIDCTLREGEQQAGIVLRRAEKLRFAHALDELELPQIEVGMPAVSAEEQATIKAIAHEGLRAKVFAACTAKREDIDRAVDCGVWGASVSLPAGYLQIEHKLRWPYERIIETAVEMTNYAHRQGLFVTMSPYDTTRTTPEFLEKLLTTLSRSGHMDRIRLVDTAGAGSPEGVGHLVRLMRRWTSCPIEVHCHDDFGLATANTLAAVAAGAEVVSTGFNGMGERAGGAATEEVVVALELLYGVKTGLRMDRFYETGRLLQELTATAIQRHKAVVGEGAFAQEAGLVVAGLLREPLVAMPYLPELVGQRTTILLGKKSGRDAVRAKLSAMGISASDEQVLAVLERVKEEGSRRGGALADEVVRGIVESILEGRQ